MAPGDGGHEKTLWIYSILDGSGDAFDVSDPEFVLADPVNRILPLPGVLSVLLLAPARLRRGGWHRGGMA